MIGGGSRLTVFSIVMTQINLHALQSCQNISNKNNKQINIPLKNESYGNLFMLQDKLNNLYFKL